MWQCLIMRILEHQIHFDGKIHLTGTLIVLKCVGYVSYGMDCWLVPWS